MTLRHLYNNLFIDPESVTALNEVKLSTEPGEQTSIYLISGNILHVHLPVGVVADRLGLEITLESH